MIGHWDAPMFYIYSGPDKRMDQLSNNPGSPDFVGPKFAMQFSKSSISKEFLAFYGSSPIL